MVVSRTRLQTRSPQRVWQRSLQSFVFGIAALVGAASLLQAYNSRLSTTRQHPAFLTSQRGAGLGFEGRELHLGRAAFDVGQALSGVFGEGEEKSDVPADVSELVEGLKESTQNALNAGISRLDVETPPGFQFGVETKQKRERLLEGDGDVAKEAVTTSDRELTRLFVEMLQPIGSGLCVAFRTRKLASEARKVWKLAPEEADIISFPEVKSKSAFAAEVGVPLKFKKQLVDLGCQCLLVVAPYTEQLRLVKEVSDTVKDNMGIILLNARVTGATRKSKLPPAFRKSLKKEFTPSFHVRFLAESKNTILFHKVMSDGSGPWILAKQREMLGGRPITEEMLRSDTEPTKEEIETAIEAYEAKPSKNPVVDFFDKENLGLSS